MERKQKIRLATVLPLALAAIAAPLVMASCSTLSNVTGTVCCTDFKPGTNMVDVNWGLSGSANVEFGASLQAIGDFSATATSMVSDLGVACKGLALDLGVDPVAARMNQDTFSGDPNKYTTAWCGLAADAIGTLKASAGLSIEIQTPNCHASVSAKADCQGSCNGHIDCTLTPAEVVANCMGGEVSGQCSGQCTGHCEGSANVAVTCNGNCSGTCEGSCAGGPQGSSQCSGTCAGKCRGDCTADGSASATCEGSCSGQCSVAFVAPSCSVTIKNPKAECNAGGSCEGSCNASATAKAECTPPAVAINFTGGADVALKVAALEKWLPQIFVVVQGKIGILKGQVEGLVKVGGDLQAGLSGTTKAVFCIVPAVAAIASAGDSITTTAAVAVNITGKI